MENMHTNVTVEKVKVLSLALTELKLILIQGSFKCWPISFSILNQYSLNNIFIYSHHCLAYLTVRRNFFVSLGEGEKFLRNVERTPFYTLY